MAEPEEIEEDLFADLYDGDDNPTETRSTVPAATESAAPVRSAVDPKEEPGYGEEPDTAVPPTSFDDEPNNHDDDYAGDNAVFDDVDMDKPQSAGPNARDEPLQMKEDGKMFVGGLNWETTDQSLYDYFSQFGEVQECTVMRDGASGRSRGFGFLTFKNPKHVNEVMVKEHFLDGKIVRPTLFEHKIENQIALGSSPAVGTKRVASYRIPDKKLKYKGLQKISQIDPKRAIPRDEQEKTSKIFVGGVSQDATEDDFTKFFEQFGRVVDATLMMDKDTGRPRGFGFVTFDSEAAVERCLEYQPLEILGKPIEVKKAQPRGKIGEEDHDPRGGRRGGKFGKDDRFDSQQVMQSQPQQNQNMAANGMTPQMMAQYWQKMQQYFAMMQQAYAANAMGGMGQMNPQMMAQFQQMQQMGGSAGMQGMNPQMQQQMMQMMQMQNGMSRAGNQGGNMGGNRPGFSAQEQQAFEQQKYEQQVLRRHGSGHHNNRGSVNAQNQGGPQSWEGMYDGEPQPDGGSQNGRGSVGAVRNNTPSGSRPPKGPTPQPQSNAPANAPTGPKNPGKPTGNFRGGRGRYHPYGR